jgi:integrase/recombinase XerD
MMPKDNYKYQSKIPSIYTADEIEALIAAADRGSAVGKRDYAIFFSCKACVACLRYSQYQVR